MRLKGRQGRFLGVTIGGWIAARAWLLWPAAPLAIGGGMATGALLDGLAMPHFQPPPPFVPMRVPPVVTPVRLDHARTTLPNVAGLKLAPIYIEQQAFVPQLAPEGFFGITPQAFPREVDVEQNPLAPSTTPPALPNASSVKRMSEGQAYLFVRPRTGRAALAPGGSLGGSQMAARVAVALDRTGPMHLAAAARFYSPLYGKGAEGAVGLDWHPLPGTPLRLSVERRIGLDHAGRDAWSAYAAGGFYRGRLPLGLEADGYAQAGVVGVRARDLFADGAMRIGRRIALGSADMVFGAGTWGAAQSGAARLDVGPRIALSLPVRRHRLTLAAEERVRIAGHTVPGSGAALTLAADF